MILIIDNYDSFVYNLARYVGISGQERKVIRNDVIDLKEIEDNPPNAIIISPGPCTPKEAGLSNEIIRRFGDRIPILGVCLGHQCIGDVYGGKVVRAPTPVHGRASNIKHDGQDLFQGLPNDMTVGRYHSLVVELGKESVLRVTAETDDGIVMAFQHKHHPVYGIQFHPESCLTTHGLDILQNFIRMTQQWNNVRKTA